MHMDIPSERLKLLKATLMSVDLVLPGEGIIKEVPFSGAWQPVGLLWRSFLFTPTTHEPPAEEEAHVCQHFAGWLITDEMTTPPREVSVFEAEELAAHYVILYLATGRSGQDINHMLMHILEEGAERADRAVKEDE